MKKRAFLLTPLLVLFALVATTEKRAEAVDVAAPVEGETMDVRPTGTTMVSDQTLYSSGRALKFTDSSVIATENVNFATSGDVVLMARAGRAGGSPTLRVSVNGTFTAPAQAITNLGAPEPYTFEVDAPPGNVTIGVRAGNTATSRNAFVDVLSFPGGGGGDATPPETSVTGGPAEGSTVTDGNVTFGFASSEAGGSFECQLVGTDAAFSPCVSPNTYNGLANGSHEFRVRATDAAGNVDPTPATRSFSVDAQQTWDCSGVQIRPGADIDAVIKADSVDNHTPFCVHAGTYNVSEPIRLRVGDKVEGEPGTFTTVGLSATKPTPVVELVGVNGTGNLFRPDGNGISITWVDLSGASGTGAGVGSAIAAGSAGSDFLVRYARIHDNASSGISSMTGRVLDSEFFSNSKEAGSLGYNGAGVKGVTAYEAGRLFVHDERGNGIWCDVGCDDDPARTNGFWVYDSVMVGNKRAGVRYENSSNQALIEDNEIHGNSYDARRGGVSLRDSQNALVESNTFGAANVAGVDYPNNDRLVAVMASDSGKASRPDLRGVEVANNRLNGEWIKGCELPDNIVTCTGND